MAAEIVVLNAERKLYQILAIITDKAVFQESSVNTNPLYHYSEMKRMKIYISYSRHYLNYIFT